MIDNGLQRISNLKPVGMTLTSLCLCDQMLTRMENLDLPVLTELMLHRNKLTEISGLDRCPRLRKLWLFQNKITSLSGLQAVPELEECWVQANRVTSLAGIEHCRALVDLGLAGNPVADFVELKRLEDLPDLHSLSLSDIHFGQVSSSPFFILSLLN
jgi:protein phosphatase 1 regulatory subunit 7